MEPDPNSLSNLHDIVEPAAVSLWPFAPGVWLLLALALIWIVTFAFLWRLRRRRNAYRRAALKELGQMDARLRSNETRKDAARELGLLLKRVALAAYPREQVAALTGEAWLAFLDDTMRGKGFASGPGRMLPAVQYESKEVSESETKQLVRLASRWVRRHRVTIDTACRPGRSQC